MEDEEGRMRRRRRRMSYGELDDERLDKSRGKKRESLELDSSEIGRARVERLEGSTSTRRSLATPKMTSESHATLPSRESAPSYRRRQKYRPSTLSTKPRIKQKWPSKDDSLPKYVYGTPADPSQPPQNTTSDIRKLGTYDNSSESEGEDEEDRSTHSEVIREKSKTRKIRVKYVNAEEPESSKPRERRLKSGQAIRDRPKNSHGSVRSRAQTTRRKSIVEERPALPLKRSASIRVLPSEGRPSLTRRHTTTSHVPKLKSPYDPSLTDTTASRRSSFLGNFFGPAVQQRHEPEKLVECLTCLSDDIPRSKSAKLKCGHRMCQSCLKRIFKLSVTDPQHMPPKCCTSDHIPLKHVDKLFDSKFKKNWNTKFAEYSTKNRIYCPARRCGEWIKPGNIHKEDGKRHGKCSRCRTKVCCLCNGKWHGMKDCPKDEDTNRLLEKAKEAGWQRCYNCRTMVELKEGCNHMTCRCTAEFCMICGLKWKSCNCPWFNYDAVEADRLDHMQNPMHAEQPEQLPNRPRRPRPNNYDDEMYRRRRQERADEELARRLQRVALEEGEEDSPTGIGDIYEIGNGAANFRNQDYIRAARNILTGTHDQATAAANYVLGVAQARGRPPPQGPEQRSMDNRHPAPQVARAPPPVMRRHTMREQAYNMAPATRASERVVPRRIRMDYAAEAALHAPTEGGHQRTSSTQDPPVLRPSVLAGLGARSGGNRVDAWRTHVDPGVPPAEGVLSM